MKKNIFFSLSLLSKKWKSLGFNEGKKNSLGKRMAKAFAFLSYLPSKK
tara:strand:+ start:111 stop:254 length:144 start_codon:yes stop_codon:yes gene_type:complete